MTVDRRPIAHWREPYIVRRTDEGTLFERTIPPICEGRLIPESTWTPELNEVFLGPPGEAVVDLRWPGGEPEERAFLQVVGGFGEDLKDWRNWPRVLTPAERPSEILA